MSQSNECPRHFIMPAARSRNFLHKKTNFVLPALIFFLSLPTFAYDETAAFDAARAGAEQNCKVQTEKIVPTCDPIQTHENASTKAAHDSIKISTELEQQLKEAVSKFRQSPEVGACDIKKVSDTVCGTGAEDAKCANSAQVKSSENLVHTAKKELKSVEYHGQQCKTAIESCERICKEFKIACPTGPLQEGETLESKVNYIKSVVKEAEEKHKTAAAEAGKFPGIAKTVLASNGGDGINRCKQNSERNEKAKQMLIDDLVPRLVAGGLTEDDAKKKARELAHEAVEAQAAKPELSGKTAEELKRLAAQDQRTVEQARAAVAKVEADRAATRAIAGGLVQGCTKDGRPCTDAELTRKADDMRIAAIQDPIKRAEEAAKRARAEFLADEANTKKRCWYINPFCDEATEYNRALERKVKQDAESIERIAAIEAARPKNPAPGDPAFDTRNGTCPNTLASASGTDRCPPWATGAVATAAGDNWVRRNIPFVGNALADAATYVGGGLAKAEQIATQTVPKLADEYIVQPTKSALEAAKVALGAEPAPKIEEASPFPKPVLAAAAPITPTEAEEIGRPDLVPGSSFVAASPDDDPLVDGGFSRAPPDAPGLPVTVAPAAPVVVEPPAAVEPPPAAPRQPPAGSTAKAPGGGTGGTGDQPPEKKAADNKAAALPPMPASADQGKPALPPQLPPQIPNEEPRPEPVAVIPTARSTGDPEEPSTDAAPVADTTVAAAVTSGLQALLDLLPTSSKTSSAIDAAPGSAGFGVQTGTGGGKGSKDKDKSRIAKKEELEEVNNGFTGGSAALGAGAKKDKNGKVIPGKEKLRNGGVQMAGTAEDGIGGPNWASILKIIRDRLHPSQRDRRIAATGGIRHREFAASMSTLFGNMNRAYADEGSTLHIGTPVNNYYTAAHVASVVGGEFRRSAQPMPTHTQTQLPAQPRQASAVPVQRQPPKSSAKIAGVSSRSLASTASLPAAGLQKTAPAKVFRPLNPKKTKVH